MEIPEYGIDDFLNTDEPYRFVTSLTDQFEQDQAIEALAYKARQLDKNINFKSLLKSYLNSTGQILGEHYTEFTEQPVELRIGTHFTADDHGISYVTEKGAQTVCMHPILPSARLINIDTGSHGMELSYRHSKQQWQTLAVPCDEIASASKIVDLSNSGISVSSDTAKNLSKYLMTAQEMNYNTLPERLSVNRFGWVGEDDFVPYSNKYVFEGEGNFKQIYDSVHNHGSAAEWYDAVKDIRQSENVIPRIVMAASLASVLVQPCKALPFIVHLWGRTGTGKTLALMLAASVWADPEGSKFIHTFNATAVGLERNAAFFHHLPMLIDELQTISKRGDFEDTMYQLTEGTGRLRGSKDNGLRVTGSWANSIITTGEQPITRQNSGGGTINRIIEIDCSSIDLFDDPHELAKILTDNYGYLGETFVNLLCDPDTMDLAKAIQETLRDKIYRVKPDVTEKQALSASLILTADHLVSEVIMKDGRELAVEDIAPYLADKDAAEKNKRAYEWLLGWVAENTAHFVDDDTDWDTFNRQVYGKRMQNGRIAIIKSVFNRECEEEGFDPTAFARWLKECGCTETESNKASKPERIGQDTVRCIVLIKSTQIEFEEVKEGEEVPW